MADSLSLTWNPPLRDRAAAWRQLAEKGDYRAIQEMADEIQPRVIGYLQTFAPRRTGAFADSIRADQFRSNGAIKIRFTAAGPLAGWITKGTRAHQIQGNPFLAFFWEKVGNRVVFAAVNHPGTAPNQFVRQAIASADVDLRSALKVAGHNLVQEIRGVR